MINYIKTQRKPLKRVKKKEIGALDGEPIFLIFIIKEILWQERD